MLRRAGEVLDKLVTTPAHSARIGGDEFAILLPGTDEAGAEKTIEDIRRLVDLNNQYYSGSALSLSLGAATSMPGETLEDVVKRADARMYEEKHRYYGLTPLESPSRGGARRGQPEILTPGGADSPQVHCGQNVAPGLLLQRRDDPCL